VSAPQPQATLARRGQRRPGPSRESVPRPTPWQGGTYEGVGASAAARAAGCARNAGARRHASAHGSHGALGARGHLRADRTRRAPGARGHLRADRTRRALRARRHVRARRARGALSGPGSGGTFGASGVPGTLGTSGAAGALSGLSQPGNVLGQRFGVTGIGKRGSGIGGRLILGRRPAGADILGVADGLSGRRLVSRGISGPWVARAHEPHCRGTSQGSCGHPHDPRRVDERSRRLTYRPLATRQRIYQELCQLHTNLPRTST
jgi:hypothetical protein